VWGGLCVARLCLRVRGVGWVHASRVELAWRSVVGWPRVWQPDLVKDGIYFTMERVGGMKTGTAGYEEIKHQSQGEEL
jgi:hypothetical protein